VRSIFTLTAAEAKRFIGRGTVRLQAFRAALENARVIVANGTTNAYIVEELTGEEMAREKYTAGVITRGRLCATAGEDRYSPHVFEKGRAVDEDWEAVLEDFTADDLFVKGANALDAEGNVGVLAGDPHGGTIGRALGIIQARGARLMCPVGLEKLIPCVQTAARSMGIDRLEAPLGMSTGLIPVTTAEVVTETRVMEKLFGVSAVHVASGGTGGSEGAVTLLAEGKTQAVQELMGFVDEIKGEEPIPAFKKSCSECDNPCRYSGN